MKTNTELQQMTKSELIDRLIKVNKLMNKIWNEAYGRNFVRILSRATLEQKSKEHIIFAFYGATNAYYNHTVIVDRRTAGTTIADLYTDMDKAVEPTYKELEDYKIGMESHLNETIRDMILGNFADLLERGVGISLDKFHTTISAGDVLVSYDILHPFSFSYRHDRSSGSERSDCYNLGTCGRIDLDNTEDDVAWMILTGLTSKMYILQPIFNEAIERFANVQRALSDRAIAIGKEYEEKIRAVVDTKLQQALNAEYGEGSFEL